MRPLKLCIFCFILLFGCSRKLSKKYLSFVVEISERDFYDEIIYETDKLIILYFWDPSSAIYTPLHTLMDKISVLYKSTVKVYKMNITKNLETFEKADCGVHCTILFLKNREEVDRIFGKLDLKTIKTKITKLL